MLALARRFGDADLNVVRADNRIYFDVPGLGLVSYSAAFGLRWHQIDPGFWLIRSLQAVGLAWDMKLPTAQRIASLQARVPSPESGV